MRSNVAYQPRRSHEANHRLADAVGEQVAGQQAAARFIEQVQADVGHGDELADAIRGLDARSDAYAKGFSRIIQKYLAAGSGQ